MLRGSIVAITKILEDFQTVRIKAEPRRPHSVARAHGGPGGLRGYVIELGERHRSVRALRQVWWRSAQVARRVRAKLSRGGR